MPQSIPDGRRRKGDSSRQQLVEAMIQAVASHGLPGATISVVAELAGVSRSLVNFHFKQKEQLLDSALDLALHTYQQSLATALAECETTPSVRLAADIRHDIHFAATHPELLALWYASWSERHSLQQYRATTLASDRIYRMAYTTCFEQLLGDTTLARRCGMIVDSFIDGLWLDCHLDPDNFSVSEAEACAEILLQSLLHTPASGANHAS